MKNLLLILLFILVSMPAFTQNPDSTALRIETSDGNIYNGILMEETEKFLRLNTSVGTINIQKSTISTRIVITQGTLKNGIYWKPNPEPNRYYFAPNGYGLEDGKSYYQNSMLLFNYFETGISDNFSLGGGVVPVLLFDGSASPLWIAPKYSIPIIQNKFNVAIGGIFGNVFAINNGLFALIYSTATYGSRDSNLSLGIGWGYAEGGTLSRPTISIGGLKRLGPKIYIVGEMYAINDEFGGGRTVLTTFGGRSLIRKISLDYGLFVVAHSDYISGLPWLGFAIPLSKA